MLTQQDMATMLLRGQVAQANIVKRLLQLEKDGCEPAEWVKAICLSHQLQGLKFSLNIGDYTSPDAVNSYNNISTQVSGDTPATDPNAQVPGNTVIINNPTAPQAPEGRWVTFDDVRWNDDHTVYTEPLWATFRPQIQLNGQRFLDPSFEFTSLPMGGFTLPAAMLDGDVYVILF